MNEDDNMGFFDFKQNESEIDVAKREADEIAKKLKSAICSAFWNEKGYAKVSTQNWAIVEEGIGFAVDKMRNVK